jgi:hypothetical protein
VTLRPGGGGYLITAFSDNLLTRLTRLPRC